MIPNVYSSYNKVLSTISSSQNLDHIKFTRNFINNFFKTYTTESRSNFGPFKTFYAEKYIACLYNSLIEELEKKEKKLLK